jgi:hypothetical protein
MSTLKPAQAPMEEATVHLLRQAFLEIRYLTAPLIQDQSTAKLQQRHAQVHALADICHNLPAYLIEERRPLLADGLRYLWRTTNLRAQQWIRSQWDDLNYDHRWLSDPEAADPHDQ